MQLDLAQIVTTLVGFVIVVLILRAYAWGPILDMLDARREKIQSDYADAEKTLVDAEDLKSDFQAKLGDIKTIEREKVQEAAKRGEAVAEGIVSEARNSADATRVKAEQDMAIEAEKAQIALRDTVVTMAIGATEKLIGENLDDAKHRQLIEEYLDNLGEMPNA